MYHPSQTHCQHFLIGMNPQYHFNDMLAPLRKSKNVMVAGKSILNRMCIMWEFMSFIYCKFYDNMTLQTPIFLIFKNPFQELIYIYL